MLRLETQIDPCQFHERTEEQSRPDCQHQRERDFHDNKSIAKTIRSPSEQPVPTALLQRFIQVNA